MGAVAAVTAVMVSPPSSGAFGPAQQAPAPAAPAVQAAAGTLQPVLPVWPISALAIENVLTAVQLELDNQPAEHPNAPNVVALEGKETALRQGLALVLSGQAGIASGYLSGLLLSATV